MQISLKFFFLTLTFFFCDRRNEEDVKIILNSINLNKLLTLSNFDCNLQIIMLLHLLTVQPGLCKTDNIN